MLLSKAALLFLGTPKVVAVVVVVLVAVVVGIGVPALNLDALVLL